MKTVRMVTLDRRGTERLGALTEDNQVIDLKEAHLLLLLSDGNTLEKSEELSQKIFPNGMKDFLSRSKVLVPIVKDIMSHIIKSKIGKAIYSMDEIRLKTPIPNPGKIIVMGNAYRETGNLATHGVKPMTSLIGPDEPILISKNHKTVIYEHELGVVIGKRCKNLSMKDENWDYIAGYTILNDVTDLGFQNDAYELDEDGNIKRNEKGRVYKPWPLPESFKLRKMLDTFCPIGPSITMRVDIEDPPKLLMKARVNGKINERYPDGRNTSELIVPPWKYVALCSQYMTMEPGDIICMGSAMSGVINPGDVVELEMEKVGILRNPVIAEK